MPRLVRDGEKTHAAAAPTAPVPASAQTQPTARRNQKPMSINKTDSDIDNAKQPPKQQEQKNNPQKQSKVGDKPGAKVFIPPPPPDVPEIQLRMWSASLRQRMKQLKQLSSEHLAGLAHVIKDDLKSSRNDTNEYSAALALVLRKSEKKDGDSSEGEDIDLAAGVYSVLYLQEEVSPEAIGRHFLALFYHSIDKRLPPAMNKYGMTALRKAFLSLDRWRKGEGEKPSKKRKTPDGVECNTGESDKAKTARKDGENPVNGQEQIMRTASDTVNLTAETGAPNPKELTQQPEKNVDDTSGNVNVDMEDSGEKKKSSTDYDDEVHATTLPSKSNETANPETLVSLDAEQSRQLKNLFAKYKSAVESFAGGRNSENATSTDFATNGGTSAALNSDCAEPGAPPNHVVESQDIQSQETQKVTASTMLTSSDTSRNDIRIVSTDVEQGISLAVGRSTAQDHNGGGGSSDNTDTAHDASSNVSVGFRRHTLRNCHIGGCPNKGGVCGLHGKLGKTCKIDGCDNFQVNGFDVCIKHGAKSCKTVGCKKKSSMNGLCIDHYQETASSGEQATNQLEIAYGETSAKPNSGSQTANHSEAENRATAGVVSVRSQIQEVSQAARMEHFNSLNNGLPSGLQPSNSSEQTQVVPSPAGPCADEWIDLTADSPVREAQTKQLASPTTSPHPTTIFKEDPPVKQLSTPPPSPPPTTIIRNPPPPPKPQPSTFSHLHRIIFSPDTVIAERGTISGCLKDYARGQMMVEFDLGYHVDGSGMSLNDAACIDVKERLKTWEPYWRVIDELGHHDIICENFVTNIGTKTAWCCPIPYDPLRNVYSSLHSCAMVRIDFIKEIAKSELSNTDGKGRNVAGFRPWGVKWGKVAQKDGHQLGERRMLMRCIPLNRSAADKKKRADLHLWPLGSFVQIKLGNGSDQVIPVTQRKQQSHAHNKWLGNSLPLDLTEYIPDMNNPLQIYISSKEVIEQASEGGEGLLSSYAVHTAICEYIDPDTLYYQLMGKSEGGDILMPKLSLRSGKKMLKECISNNTITLDSDEEEGGGESEDDFLTFSLLCHASKKCIETPVRGQQCTHLQCFDLRNYLITNKVVSAGRWRCPYCENFVSVRDLVHCGLFQAILDDLREQIVPGVRDRVCVKADGSWYLLDENKVRSRKSGITADTAASALEANGSKGVEPDVIELV